MKLKQIILNKTFIVEYKGKEYCVDYLNSDKHTLGLLNRDIWEVTRNGENVNIYLFNNHSRKEKKEVKKNIILIKKLISFCVKNFNDYKFNL